MVRLPVNRDHSNGGNWEQYPVWINRIHVEGLWTELEQNHAMMVDYCPMRVRR